MPPRKTKQPPKKKAATNGYKLPDPIEPNEILIDMVKNKWRLGKSIGQGGFGEIYLASDNINKVVDDKANFVVKIEPHSNGPLFTEMHCYLRIAKPELVDAWVKEKRLKRLGMPKYLGSGSHEYKGQKYRFMVMERFGSDLQKILEQHSKRLSFKTVYQVGIQILDVLEYIHSKEYIHADIKASNLLVGYQPGTENQVFLVDYGLACRYANDGQHKEYRYDQRKAHDGTIEFTSRDAHIGAHSRRGDLEILGYNLMQWMCSRLPWEDNLQDCNYVASQKRGFMDEVERFLNRCFPETKPPGMLKYLKYIANLTFDEKPDYELCRNILRDGLKARGYSDDGKLVFLSATPKPTSKKPKSKLTAKKVSKRTSEEIRSESEDDVDEGKETNLRTTKRRKASDTKATTSSEKENLKNKVNTKKKGKKVKPPVVLKEMTDSTGLSNPTPQMLELMAAKGKKKP